MSIGNRGPAGAPGPGFQVVNKFGQNNDIDTGSVPETIWSHGGVFPFIDTGIAMDLVSADAADALAGTGAQKARLTYYRTDNTEVEADFDLDGLTPVQIDNDLKICTRVEIIQTGSGKTNAGEINLVDRATGLVVYQSVEPGEGQTLSAVQICPKGKKGCVKAHTTSYARNQAPFGMADLRLRLRLNEGSILTKWPATISTDKPEDDKIYTTGGIEMAVGDILFWEAILVSVNDVPIQAEFDIEFEDA